VKASLASLGEWLKVYEPTPRLLFQTRSLDCGERGIDGASLLQRHFRYRLISVSRSKPFQWGFDILSNLDSLVAAVDAGKKGMPYGVRLVARPARLDGFRLLTA
jgi:hypothetical protein